VCSSDLDRKTLEARVVQCVFQERKGDTWKVISFHAKRARGLMARHIIDHRIDAAEDLTGFAEEGYAFDEAASTPERLVFRRRAAGRGAVTTAVSSSIRAAAVCL